MKLFYRKKGIFALVLSLVMIVSSIIPMTVRAQDSDTDKLLNVDIKINYIAKNTEFGVYEIESHTIKSFENIPAFTKLKDLNIDYSDGGKVQAVDGCKVLGYVVTSVHFKSSGKYVNNDVPVKDYVITPNNAFTTVVKSIFVCKLPSGITVDNYAARRAACSSAIRCS